MVAAFALRKDFPLQALRLGATDYLVKPINFRHLKNILSRVTPPSEMTKRIATFEKDASIFQHGDVGDALYLILEGKVRISRQIPGMGEEALAVLGPGQVFGEMALLDESPRSADALCHESCRLLAIAKEELDDLLFQDKELAYEVLWSTVHMLVGRLRSTNDKLTMLGISGRFS